MSQGTHLDNAWFEFRLSRGVIAKCPRFYQRAEGSPVAHGVLAGDPSLRLRNGCAQDDSVDAVKNSNRATITF